MSIELFNLTRGDKFTLVDSEGTRVPPYAAEPKELEVYTYYHIDGMYSFIKDSKGNVVHFAAWTEVNKV